MTQPSKVVAHVRELWPVFLVSLAVVAAGTIAGSIFDHTHRVAAEEPSSPAVQAVPGPDHTQVLTVADWKVQLTLPLAEELPLVSYSAHAGSSIGFSAADLERLGPSCQASADTLGTLLRITHGQALPTPSTTIRSFIGTVDDFDYHYDMPQNDCSNTQTGQSIVNRETSILLEALSSLSPAR